MGNTRQVIVGLIIGIVIVGVIIFIVVGIKYLLKTKISTKDLFKKWQFWIVIFALFTGISYITPPASSQEIIGNVLHIYRDGKHDRRVWYQHEAARELESANIPNGVTEVCVWYKSEFTDAKGNVSEDTVYRISVSTQDLEEINWNNFLPENIESLPSATVYAWQGIE